MAGKKTKIRVNPGLRALDAVRVDDDLIVTKNWVEVSATLAKSLVSSTRQGQPVFEVMDAGDDEAPAETPTPADEPAVTAADEAE